MWKSSGPMTSLGRPESSTASDAASSTAGDAASSAAGDAASSAAGDASSAAHPHRASSATSPQFIKLCRKYLLDPELDSVLTTAVMSNGETTLVCIGERHTRHTQCVSIYDALVGLVEENKRNPIEIDLMIEYLQYASALSAHDETRGALDEIKYDPTSAQITNIRLHFRRCIVTRDCAVRVHWTDPTETFFASVNKKDLPLWLHRLSKAALNSDDWTRERFISSQFNKESDIPKILTENRIVVNEIRKATEVNPHFTLEFAIRIFMNWWTERTTSYMYTANGWQWSVGMHLRSVVDIYTAARLVKLRMKNVIFYAGDLHVNHVIEILQNLGFNLLEHNKKTGHCAATGGKRLRRGTPLRRCSSSRGRSTPKGGRRRRTARR